MEADFHILIIWNWMGSPTLFGSLAKKWRSFLRYFPMPSFPKAERCSAWQRPSSTLPIIPWLKPPTHILFQKQAPAQSARKSFPENVRGDKIKKAQKYSLPTNRSVFLYGNFTILPFWKNNIFIKFDDISVSSGRFWHAYWIFSAYQSLITMWFWKN